MPALALTHVNLAAVRAVLQQTASTEVVMPIVADSRGSWPTGDIRTTIGEIFRTWDVPFASILSTGVSANNGARDGFGQLNIGLTGISVAEVAPGATCPNSSIVNRLPVTISTHWTTSTPSNPHFGRYIEGRVTAGGDMDSTALSSSTGGQFFRGDPAQGRNIASITQYVVTDTRAGIWVPTRTSFGYNGTATTHGPVSYSAPPAASSGLLITSNVLTHGTTTGTQVTFWHRHTVSPSIGTGIAVAGTKIRYGSTGLTAGTLSTGGFSTSDQLPEVNAGRPNNTDWKYTDQGLQEVLSKMFEASGKPVLFYIELGQNQSTNTGYEEWDGVTVGLYKENIRLIINRLRAAATAVGASSITILLVCPWQATTAFDRNVAMAAALRSLAIEENVSYLDLQAELVARGFSSNANGLADAFCVVGDVPASGDRIHSGWRGMTEALGPTKYDVISTATSPSRKSSGMSIGLGIAI